MTWRIEFHKMMKVVPLFMDWATWRQMALPKYGGITVILPEVLNLREDFDPGARISGAFRLPQRFD